MVLYSQTWNFIKKFPSIVRYFVIDKNESLTMLHLKLTYLYILCYILFIMNWGCISVSCMNMMREGNFG